jgi:hypothetical protein
VYPREVIADRNGIDDKGILYICRSNWKELQTIILSKNREDEAENPIGNRSCQYLAKAKWPKLKKLYLGIDFYYRERTLIGSEGCQQLAKVRLDPYIFLRIL